MPHVDLQALTSQVRAILVDPHAVAVTGDRALDTALAMLADHRRAGRPLTASLLAYWTTPTAPPHVSHS